MNYRDAALLLPIALSLGCGNERVYGSRAEDAGARGPVGAVDGSVGAPTRGDNDVDDGDDTQNITVEVGGDASATPADGAGEDASVGNATEHVSTSPSGSDAPSPTTTAVETPGSPPSEITSAGTGVAGSSAAPQDTLAPDGDTLTHSPSNGEDSTTTPDIDPSECDLINGSFEDAASNPGSGVYLPTGSTTLVGWSVVEGSVHYSEDLWQYADGHRGLDLNGGSPGGVEQAVATVPGQAYLVRFALSGNPDRTSPGADTSQTYKGVQVWAGDHSQTYTFDVTGKDAQNMGWVEHEFTFNATSTTSELRIRSITYSEYWGPAVDNVRMYGCAP